jgi:hypothetical protein
LTDKYHKFTIGDKSNNGQDASLRIEMGNINLDKLPLSAIRRYFVVTNPDTKVSYIRTKKEDKNEFKQKDYEN